MLICENVPLGTLTSFRVGGPAKKVLYPESVGEAAQLLLELKEKNEKYVVLGRGSNVLASDDGYDGTVVILSEMNRVMRIDGGLYAEAGITLAALAQAALKEGLTGLEFASGIPGSLGGGLFMNAGAYGGELKQVVVNVTALTPDGALKTLSNEEAAFGYRESIFQKNGWLILSAELKLEAGDPEQIRATMFELNARRKEKQPLEFPSAGSTFKRPEGDFAGRLIEDAQLKGVRIGGAQVSPKHAGFIVNTGSATAAEIRALIQYVREKVEKKSGIRLEPEVRFLGFPGEN